MAIYKCLVDKPRVRDKNTKERYEKGKEYDVTVKRMTEIEKTLAEKHPDIVFFERVDKKEE